MVNGFVYLQNANQTRMLPLVCASIITHVKTSFFFDGIDANGLTQDVSNVVVSVMKNMLKLPNMQSQLQEPLSKLLAAVPADLTHFEKNFTSFLSDVHAQCFENSVAANANEEDRVNHFSVSIDFINCILSHIEGIIDKGAPSELKHMQIPQVFYEILYWPLSLTIVSVGQNLSQVYTISRDVSKFLDINCITMT